MMLMNQEFSTQINSFVQKLDSINIDEISTSPLVKEYLQSVLQNKHYYTKIYAFVLQNTLTKSNKKIEEISLLDFGCGNGLLAMFAKHCGFAKVYGCDFNNDFVEASNTLNKVINIEIDGWFVSNEDELLNTCNHLKLDVVIGTDVIEHIYDLNLFFKNIHLLNPAMVTGFTTASVYDNYFKRKKLYKLMLQDETIGSNAFHATSKDEYAGISYLEIRKIIITKLFPQLQQNVVDILATATRGLRKNDIAIYVNKYFETSIIIDVLSTNKFNTCDPITGNFTERMLTLKEYKSLYHHNQFSLEVISCFYSAEGKNIKSIVQKMLNVFIHTFKTTFLSRTISPLILLVGKPINKKSFNSF